MRENISGGIPLRNVTVLDLGSCNLMLHVTLAEKMRQ